jgi:hypothetical protein
LKSKQKPTTAGQKSRRRFTKTLAAALVAAPAVAASSGASAQTATPAREPKAPPNPQTTPTPPATPTPQPKPSPVAEAYAEVARARFGKQLSDEELARVRRDLEGNVRAAERLGASKLKNSDEPDFIFGA